MVECLFCTITTSKKAPSVSWLGYTLPVNFLNIRASVCTGVCVVGKGEKIKENENIKRELRAKNECGECSGSPYAVKKWLSGRIKERRDVFKSRVNYFNRLLENTFIQKQAINVVNNHHQQ